MEIPLCLLSHAAGVPSISAPSPVLTVLAQIAADFLGENTPDVSVVFAGLFQALLLLSFLFSL